MPFLTELILIYYTVALRRRSFSQGKCLATQRHWICVPPLRKSKWPRPLYRPLHSVGNPGLTGEFYSYQGPIFMVGTFKQGNSSKRPCLSQEDTFSPRLHGNCILKIFVLMCSLGQKVIHKLIICWSKVFTPFNSFIWLRGKENLVKAFQEVR